MVVLTRKIHLGLERLGWSWSQIFLWSGLIHLLMASVSLMRTEMTGDWVRAVSQILLLLLLQTYNTVSDLLVMTCCGLFVYIHLLCKDYLGSVLAHAAVDRFKIRQFLWRCLSVELFKRACLLKYWHLFRAWPLHLRLGVLLECVGGLYLGHYHLLLVMNERVICTIDTITIEKELLDNVTASWSWSLPWRVVARCLCDAVTCLLLVLLLWLIVDLF